MIIVCQSLEIPAEPPSITIPQIGVIKKARAAFEELPSLGTYLVQFQDQLAAQLAPVLGYIELLEAAMALYNCTQAIPKAIMTLSPTPIFDCFKNLKKAIGVIISRVPPFAWIRTLLDIIDYVMDVINEALSFILEVDAKLAQYKSTIDGARLRGNTDLEAIMDCAVGDMKMQFRNMAPMMLMMLPLMQPLMKIINTYSPDPRLQDADQVNEALNTYFAAAFAALAAGTELPALPSYLPTKDRLWAEGKAALVKSSGDMEDWVASQIPPLGWLLVSMVQCYNAGVTAYNALAPLVGKDADKVELSVPDTNFF